MMVLNWALLHASVQCAAVLGHSQFGRHSLKAFLWAAPSTITSPVLSSLGPTQTAAGDCTILQLACTSQVASTTNVQQDQQNAVWME